MRALGSASRRMKVHKSVVEVSRCARACVCVRGCVCVCVCVSVCVEFE